ncbi:MAG: DUF3667 domain-containing protein [Gammaproteobacteria bacterium]|nr:DUF3667 domain-containing protein [Gammaproteobacteria bacterium]MDD9894828.1 DUF3667 domain-containing protein [Gammaproteobacteria bacterium]
MSESTLPREIHCLNCGEPLAGIFCAQCGQEDKEVRRPFLFFLREFLRVAFELDGRAYRTIYFLFTRPGYLTKEYFAGRRISYTPPLRLFLIISIGFFIIIGFVTTISSIQQNMEEIDNAGELPAAEENPAAEEILAAQEILAAEEVLENLPEDIADDINLQFSIAGEPIEVNPAAEDGLTEEDQDEIREQFSQLTIPFLSAETNQGLTRYMAEQVIDNIDEVMDDPAGFFLDSLDYLTFFILLMMPFLALIQKILFVFTRKFYVEHLILTMHNHAFLFIAIFMIIIVSAVESAQIPYLSALFNYIYIALVIWIFLYLFLSLKFYFERGYFLTSFLFLSISLIYFFVSSIGLSVFTALFFILS